jgi:chromate transporter
MPDTLKLSPALGVLWAFLKLGMSSFGGPVAHIGYFREEFVVRRHWLEDSAFSDLVALCQFLPGPASSQVGFAIGLMRAGYWGALAAWIGFTLPSAAALVLFADGVSALRGPISVGLVHGLKLVAVAIVAQAVWGMARTLCPDRQRASIGGVAALIMLLGAPWIPQIAAIIVGAVAGLWFCRNPASAPKAGAAAPMATTAAPMATTAIPVATAAAPMAAIAVPVSRRAGLVSLAMFVLFAVGPLLLRGLELPPAVTLFDAFYRSGALVFGGGHVVLPLLRDAFVSPGWVSDDAFLAGYGAAQAVPGPLFTFAAYLGAVVSLSPHGLAGAMLGLIAIFLPGLLILIAALPFWHTLRTRAAAQASMRGVNAAVVGLLGAALYNPVWTSSVKTPSDIAVALVGFVLLTIWRAPPLLVVIMGALAGIGLV